jgi:hypothetical protein
MLTKVASARCVDMRWISTLDGTIITYSTVWMAAQIGWEIEYYCTLIVMLKCIVKSYK